MNVTMNPDVYERLWSALRTDFDLVITNYLSKSGWGYETLAAAAKYRHVTSYYNWICVKQGRIADSYVAHAEAVIKLIIKTAKEVWLPPWLKNDNDVDGDGIGVRGFGYTKDIVSTKRKIGGLFLLWLVYQNQPRLPERRFHIELCVEDVEEIKKFENEMMKLNLKIRGRGISGLRHQVKTIICQLKTIGAFDVVVNRDALGADEFMRNYLQLRSQLAELGEIDLSKQWREKFLFDGNFSRLLTSLDEYIKGLQVYHKKLGSDTGIEILKAFEPHIAKAIKLKTREERYDFFKELMLRLIREKKYSADHPFVKRMYAIFDKIIMEAPPAAENSNGKIGKIFSPSLPALLQGNETENIGPMDSEFSSDEEDFEMISIPGELKLLTPTGGGNGSRTPERQGIVINKTLQISPAKSTRSIEEDLLFPDFASNSGSSPGRTFESPTKAGVFAKHFDEACPIKLESTPGMGYLIDANAHSSKNTFGSDVEVLSPVVSKTKEDLEFWNKLTLEEKREYAKKFKVNLEKMDKVKTILFKINQGMGNLAKRAMAPQKNAVPVTRDTLVAEAVRKRKIHTIKPRKSRARPKDDKTLNESPETLNNMMKALKIKSKVREELLDKFHELNSKDAEVQPELDGSRVGFGKYMEMMPKTQDKSVGADMGEGQVGPSSSSCHGTTPGDLSKESATKRQSYFGRSCGRQ